MTKSSRRERKQQLDELEEYLNVTTAEVRAQEPRVNALTEWLENRNRDNGFGRDFEWTLTRPKGAA